MAELLFAIGDSAWQSVASLEQIDVPQGLPLRFNLASGGNWFGHGFAHRQPWPLQTEPIINEHFAVNNCQAPIWMCSAGLAIFVETDAELAVSINAGGDGELRARCDASPVTARLFVAADLPTAHRLLMAHLGWPNDPPDRQLLGDSIFCTWTQFPRRINQQRIVQMAQAIREQQYPCSVITIDDRWESAYGELTFSDEFPDPAGMARQLHQMGFRVLLWVTPFVNQEARTFRQLAGQDVLVGRKDGAGPALLKWWGGTAGLVDLTAPAGRDWFRSQLLRLIEEVGIDGFKIDGGDAKYQPPSAEANWANYPGPSGYADRLLALFEEIAPGRCETRTMWQSQRRNILWRQGGKDSHWGIDNGLRAMIHLGLNMALMGYDIQIPDMIPGRVQTMVADMALPTDELFIRWTEASAFWPIMQFSYYPWNYAKPTADAARGVALAHKAIEEYIGQQATSRSAPLIRPMWYDHPSVEPFYAIGDQFMLGSDLVIAPVVSPGATCRDVFLPPGRWRDAWTGQDPADGRQTQMDAGSVRHLADYPAPCPGLPVFVRAENTALFDSLHGALSRIERGTVPPGVTTATYLAGVNRDLNVTG